MRHHPDCDVYHALTYNKTLNAYTPEGPRANPDDYTCLCPPYVGNHYALTEEEANALPRTAPGISTLDEFQGYRVIAKNRNGIPVASWFSR